MADPTNEYCACLADIEAAAERVRAHVTRTPVVCAAPLDALSNAGAGGTSFLFKCEALQVSGSFKFRGACNAVFGLEAHEAAKGVVTHSSGNHAAALALAARSRGIPAHIVVPRGAPGVKVAAIQAAGAQLQFCEATMDAREAACAEIMERTGATLVPPYNSGVVVAGQATIALELLEQARELEQFGGLDAIVVPISGGGMTSGIALAVKALSPDTLIIAAEPVGEGGSEADVLASKAAGRLVDDLPKPQTIADGLCARMGDKTWPIVRDLVDEVVTVTEPEIRQAMRACYEQLKVAVEPSGAVGLAAAVSDGWAAVPRLRRCARVGVILCGGNVDVLRLGEHFEGTHSTYAPPRQ